MDNTELRAELQRTVNEMQAAQVEFDAFLCLVDSSGMQNNEAKIQKRCAEVHQALDLLIKAKLAYYDAARAWGEATSKEGEPEPPTNYTKRQ